MQVVVVPVARFSWELMRTVMWTMFWIRGARCKGLELLSRTFSPVPKQIDIVLAVA